MIRRILTTGIGLLSVTLAQLNAAEYFVHLAGSDADSGRSRTNAFATIQKGVDALTPGDVLTILPGEYFGSVRRDGLGASNAVTTIRAAIPGTVVLRGDVPVPLFRKLEGTRYVHVAEVALPGPAQRVNELDTLTILTPMPNVAGLDFAPGTFHHDPAAGTLYVAPPDTDGGTYGDANVPGNDAANRSRLVNNLAWGNGTDVKIKTGVAFFHTVEYCTAPGRWSLRPENVSHSLIGGIPGHQEHSGGNIVLDAESGLDVTAEFADPDHHDYRLQATSRFRGAAPDGSDRGPNPYKANVFFVKPGGDDKADGLSVSNAWRSLGRATRELQPGDTLYLLPGRYEGALELELKRQAPDPVSIRGRGTEPVVIQGAVRIESTTPVEFQRIRFEQTITLRGDFEAGGPPHSGGPTSPHSTSGATRGTKRADHTIVAGGPPHSGGPTSQHSTSGATRGTKRVVSATFINCHFTATNTALRVTGIDGLRVEHCAFSNFTEAAIALTNRLNVDLRGNAATRFPVRTSCTLIAETGTMMLP